MRRRQDRRKQAPRRPIAAFTFIELLMVVAIVSILVAIALPAYRIYEIRAQIAEGIVFLGDAKTAVNDFYARWGRMPVDNAEAGLRGPEIQGKYIRRLDLNGGVLVASLQLGGDLSGQAVERTLTLRPWLNESAAGAPIVWTCGEAESLAPKTYHAIGAIADNPVEAKWLPTTCRSK